MPADLFQGVTPYSIEAEQIARRRKLAEAMQAQSLQMDPTQMVSGRAIPYSPVQGLNKLAQALSGARGQALATEESKGLSERYSAALARAMGGMPQPRQETYQQEQPGPVQPGQPPLSIPQQRTVQPSMQDYAGWMGRDLAPLGAGAVGMGGTLLGLQQKQAELSKRKLQQRDLGDRIVDVDQDTGEQVGPARLKGPAPKAAEGTWSAPYQMGGAWVQKNDATGQVRQAVGREPVTKVNVPPPITAVTIQDPNDPNGTIVIDGRTKQVLGKGPKFSEAGKMEAKRQFNMQGIGATIAEAESLLTDKAKPPTGSGVGSLVDTAAGFVGMTPEGAKEAQQLRAIGGALTSKMPRMEGPQSDRDTLLYKEMSGMVGDSTIPVERRIAALEKVKEIWAKYERLNPGTFEDRREGGFGAPPPGAVRPRNR